MSKLYVNICIKGERFKKAAEGGGGDEGTENGVGGGGWGDCVGREDCGSRGGWRGA